MAPQDPAVVPAPEAEAAAQREAPSMAAAW